MYGLYYKYQTQFQIAPACKATPKVIQKKKGKKKQNKENAIVVEKQAYSNNDASCVNPRKGHHWIPNGCKTILTSISMLSLKSCIGLEDNMLNFIIVRLVHAKAT